MSVQSILEQFHAIASDPAGRKDTYINNAEKLVLVSPVYTPEEIIHSMGLVPFGAWGGDLTLNKSKEYFPAFICAVMQSMLELGIAGAYKGASAIVIPSLCESLKCLGQNWKYAVKDIPFIPMTYPQNRNNDVGRAFTRAGYERVIRDLEAATGAKFSEEKLAESIKVYNAHNAAMRKISEVIAAHPEVTASQRCDVFKSAWFMKKEEHTALVNELLDALEAEVPGAEGIPVMTSGILCDSPSLLAIFDEFSFRVVADDVAAESRQYRVDAPEDMAPLDALCEKFARMDNCSVLWDVEKKRANLIVETAKSRGAKGLILALTKFCDPEEFDVPIIKRACDAAKLPMALIEVDRQMAGHEQARTLLEAFREVL